MEILLVSMVEWYFQLLKIYFLDQNKKNKVRYIVRSGQTDSEDDKIESEDISNDAEKWDFPPVLEEFNLMDLDVDPAAIEELFGDERSV